MIAILTAYFFTCYSQVDSDPAAILSESELAISTIVAASFQASMQQTGNRKGKNLEAVADVVFSRVKEGSTPFFFSKAMVEKPALASSDSERVIHNEYVYRYDYTNNTYVNKGKYNEGGSQYTGFGSIAWLPFFCNKNPFSIHAEDSLTFLGERKVYQQLCNLVRIERKGGTSLVYIDKHTKLPVKIENLSNDNTGSTLFAFKNLTTDFKPDSSLFVIAETGNQHPKNSSVAKQSSSRMKPEDQHLLQHGVRAPDWQLKTTTGHSRKLSDYKGKLILLDFFASWCVPCKLYTPLLTELHAKYKDSGLVILGMNYMETKTAKTIAAKQAWNTEVIANAEKIAEKYKVYSIPVIYLINRKGVIILSLSGHDEHAESKVREAVKSYLSKQ